MFSKCAGGSVQRFRLVVTCTSRLANISATDRGNTGEHNGPDKEKTDVGFAAERAHQSYRAEGSIYFAPDGLCGEKKNIASNRAGSRRDIRKPSACLCSGLA